MSCGQGDKCCSSGKKVNIQPINPNGDSELALFMRSMFDDLAAMKEQVANGDSVLIELDHEKILSAHATEPEKANSPEYKAFADGYLNIIDALNSAEASERVVLYENLIENCISCHQVLCPGPIVKINRLKLDNQNTD
jgi:hypothetical protein